MGSNFVRHMYTRYPKARIWNLDLLTYAGNKENLLDIEKVEAAKKDDEKRYTFVHGDICDAALLEKLFKANKFDLVVHFAAESHVDRSVFNVADFIRTNIEGTRHLMEAVQRHKAKRFVHISTDEIYGDVKNGFSDERAPLEPSNPYATSKAGADLLVQSYIKTFKIPAVIVRGSNNYGPYQYPEKLIPLAISNLIEGKKIPVHGAGDQVRSWVHVNDFCTAVDIVSHYAPLYCIYNVSGEQRTNLEVLKSIASALEKNLDDHKEHVTDRPAADSRYAVSGKKIETELGWKRAETFDTAIPKLVTWYLDNKPWWKRIKEKSEYSNHYEKQAKAQWY